MSPLRKSRPPVHTKPTVLAKMSEERFAAGLMAMALIAIRVGRQTAALNPGTAKVQ